MLKFYYDLMSQPSRALYLFIKSNKIPFEGCKIALRKGEHMTEEFAKINPFKKVPAIVHNNFHLAESVAIVRYLDRNFTLQDQWYPKDVKVRSKIDEYLEWQHLNTRMFGGMVFTTKFLNPLLTGEPVDEKRLENFEDGLRRSLETIENVFLAEGPFLCGREEASVADLFCACELEQPRVCGYDVFAGFPRVATWMKLLKSKLDPEYDEAHKYIYAVEKKFRPVSKI